MYPFETARGYPRNRWYVAAYSDEISSTPLQRTLLDTPVALYRTDAGKAVAMYGLCPHRYYPLALGRVEGDALVCGYHGFTFAASGKCVRIPAQGTGAGFVQPTYPLEERGYLTWIWMGDATLADATLIPPYEDFGLGQAGWAHSGRDHFALAARSQLLIDNLMDLTHLPNIHHHIPGGEMFARTKHLMQERPCSLRLLQEMKCSWNSFLSFMYGEDERFEGEAKALSITDFYGPELIRTSGPIIANPSGRDRTHALGTIYFLHAITPETATTTHYFGFQTRNFRTDNDAFGVAMAEADTAIRAQDVTAIAAVEEWVERGAAAQRELLARSDRPAMMVRERIRAMIRAEEMPGHDASERLPAMAG